MSGLDAAQVERYGRQILLDEIGGAGQRRLLDARVLVVGAGGLGSPTARYLAAAGVGRLTILDPDVVAPTDLHRQILYDDGDVGRPKAERAKASLEAACPAVRVEARQARFEAGDAAGWLAGHDLVLDGSDAFETRFACNDAALSAGVPLVHGAVLRWSGQVTVVRRGEGGCFRCLFEAPPPPGEVPPCSEAGVIGAVAGVVGTVMATEALKVLLGLGPESVLEGRLFTWDGLRGAGRVVPLPKRPGCPACGASPSLAAGAEAAP